MSGEWRGQAPWKRLGSVGSLWGCRCGASEARYYDDYDDYDDRDNMTTAAHAWLKSERRGNRPTPSDCSPRGRVRSVRLCELAQHTSSTRAAAEAAAAPSEAVIISATPAAPVAPAAGAGASALDRPSPAARSCTNDSRPSPVATIADSLVHSFAVSATARGPRSTIRAQSSTRELSSSGLPPLSSASLAHSAVCACKAPADWQAAQMAIRPHASQQPSCLAASAAVQKPQRVDRRCGSSAIASDSDEQSRVPA